MTEQQLDDWLAYDSVSPISLGERLDMLFARTLVCWMKQGTAWSDLIPDWRGLVRQWGKPSSLQQLLEFVESQRDGDHAQ